MIWLSRIRNKKKLIKFPFWAFADSLQWTQASEEAAAAWIFLWMLLHFHWCLPSASSSVAPPFPPPHVFFLYSMLLTWSFISPSSSMIFKLGKGGLIELFISGIFGVILSNLWYSLIIFTLIGNLGCLYL